MNEQEDQVLDNHRLLQVVNLQIADGDRQVLQQFGLSSARFFALGHIADHEQVTATDLCQLMLCDKANVARLLDGLRQEGLVMRERDAADGRRACITLTAAGRARWEAADEARRAAVRERLSAFTAGEQASFNDLLRRLKDRLDQYLGALAANRS